MSQGNVETVRRWLAARGASSEETLAAIAEFFDPDVDYYPVRKFPEAQPCHGLEESLQLVPLPIPRRVFYARSGRSRT
jgi:hypothetical protein